MRVQGNLSTACLLPVRLEGWHFYSVCHTGILERKNCQILEGSDHLNASEIRVQTSASGYQPGLLSDTLCGVTGLAGVLWVSGQNEVGESLPSGVNL